MPEDRPNSDSRQISNGEDPNVPLRTDLALEAIPGFAYEVEVASGRMRLGATAAKVMGLDQATLPRNEAEWLCRVEGFQEDAIQTRNRAMQSCDFGFEVEYRLNFGNGPRIVSDRARLASRDPAVYAGIIIDVTEERRLQERLQYLTFEIDHRVKNALANVTSLASLAVASEAGKPESSSNRHTFVDALNDRIHAYARGHTTVAENGWDGAYVAEVATAEFRAMGLEHRVRCEGPAIMVRPSVAQALAMAFHELCRNARDHGALTSGGEAMLTWRREDDVFSMSWADYPAGRQPGAQQYAPSWEGFGLQILTGMLTLETRGEATLLHDEQGASYTFRCAANALLPSSSGGRSDSYPAAKEEQDLTRPRILIVEDVWTTAMVAANAIRAKGWSVLGPVQTVDAALQQLDLVPDVVVFDLMLRDRIAVAVAEVMKARDIPFVVATGYPGRADLPVLRGVPHIKKPYLETELIGTLQRIMEGRASASSDD